MYFRNSNITTRAYNNNNKNFQPPFQTIYYNRYNSQGSLHIYSLYNLYNRELFRRVWKFNDCK